MPRKIQLTILVGAIALLTQTMLAQGTPTLAGSLQFTLTPSSNSSNKSIPGLATFTSDGSVVETDGTEAAPGQARPGTPLTFGTPGHDIWQPSPAVPNWFVRFISILVNPDGSFRAKRTVEFTVGLSAAGDSFSGGYGFVVTDASGHLISTGSGTVTGQLIEHPFLP
jgi:hypothetical protein